MSWGCRTCEEPQETENHQIRLAQKERRTQGINDIGEI